MKYSHLPEVNNLLLLRHRVKFDNTQRCADSERPVQNVHTKNNRIPLRETRDDLESARPDSLRGCVSPFGLSNFRIVRRERIEEVINNIS